MEKCEHFRKKRNGWKGNCWDSLKDYDGKKDYCHWWTDDLMEKMNAEDEKWREDIPRAKERSTMSPKEDNEAPTKKFKSTDGNEFNGYSTMQLFDTLDYHNKGQQKIIDELKRRKSIM